MQATGTARPATSTTLRRAWSATSAGQGALRALSCLLAWVVALTCAQVQPLAFQPVYCTKQRQQIGGMPAGVGQGSALCPQLQRLVQLLAVQSVGQKTAIRSVGQAADSKPPASRTEVPTCKRCGTWLFPATGGPVSGMLGIVELRLLPLKRVLLGVAGDWLCSSCGKSNFARRTECYRCDAPR